MPQNPNDPRVQAYYRQQRERAEASAAQGQQGGAQTAASIYQKLVNSDQNNPNNGRDQMADATKLTGYQVGGMLPSGGLNKMAQGATRAVGDPGAMMGGPEGAMAGNALEHAGPVLMAALTKMGLHGTASALLRELKMGGKGGKKGSVNVDTSPATIGSGRELTGGVDKSWKAPRTARPVSKPGKPGGPKVTAKVERSAGPSGAKSAAPKGSTAKAGSGARAPGKKAGGTRALTGGKSRPRVQDGGRIEARASGPMARPGRVGPQKALSGGKPPKTGGRAKTPPKTSAGRNEGGAGARAMKAKSAPAKASTAKKAPAKKTPSRATSKSMNKSFVDSFRKKKKK